MRKRFLNVVLALGLVAGLIAGTMGSASADVVLGSGSELVALPWVPNGETMADTGPWYGSVTVQNIEAFRVWITFNQTAGGINNNLLVTTLEPFASKTFTAAQLGIPADSYAGVVVRSSWYFSPNGGLIGPGDPVGLGICTGLETQTIQVTRGNTANGADVLATGDIIGIARVYEAIDPPGANDPTITNEYTQPDDYIFAGNAINWSPPGNEPQPGRTYYVDVIKAGTCRAPQIAAVEKHITTGAAGTGPMSNFQARTNPPIITVDGYTGIPSSDIPWGPASAFCELNSGAAALLGCNGVGAYLLGVPIPGTFDGHGYLPIVQTNNGWESVIHLTNVDASSPSFASVTITLYAAGGQGAAGTSVGQFTTLIGPGQSTRWDISDLVPDGFVGSAWITSDYGVVSVVNRLKPSTRMALTNQSAPSLLATTSPSSGTGTPSVTADLYRMVAPLVFQNFNGWNTGVNIANISEFTNTVTVTWYNATGNVVGQDQVTIPAKGMEFVYMPYRQDYDLNPGFVGSAVLTSLLPFHTAIDEVKYMGQAASSADDGGQAMSYIATAAGASAGQAPDAHNETSPAGSFAKLALPLVQKGNPATGMGDASGINLFNLAYTGPGEGPGTSTIWVWFFQPSGALAAPTLGQPMVLSLPAYANATIYTMSPTNNLTEMSTGFQGSAIVAPTAGSGSIFGVSNNVNYAIDGDGSAVFNLVNQWGQFRLFCSQSGDGTPLSGLAGCIYQ